MKSSVPKVLHTICGRPMISYVLDLVKRSGIKNTVIVVGHKQNYVKNYLPKGIKIAVQNKLLGTADAVKRAMPALKSFKGTVLVLYADNPLLKAETVKKLLKHHNENNFAATLLTAKLEDPSGYGRIVRDKCNCITKIIEQKEANDFEKGIKEINTGIICFNKDKLAALLKDVKPNNLKKEFYLTDVIGLFHKKEYLIERVKVLDINETLGINSRVELAR
ncbi:MAG: sugar phosphate nucleotidyltransferase, partial [Candidatus Omnitrophica bacterium]|nr:sugar phosphate nucleotidyltransferase [Candidatus Omnitrophota bacterium]